ncbi:MAG TPA: rod shape-determining protein MreC [Candidatus Binataceae bacterium]|nr:rod shape-determining protein MreC [Candidatus Binataceae bacterium]
MKGSFLWRNRVMLTGAVLLIVALHMISVGVRPGDRFAMPSEALLEGVRPVASASARLGDGASGLVHGYLDLVHAQAENAGLRDQLARMNTERARLAELEIENRHLEELLELRDALEVDAIAANVIGSDATGLSRTMILGQGYDDGLREGMAVLSNQGVVGKVIAVSARASRVLLINDHNSALDGFDQRSRARGIVAGVVDDGLTMRYVERSEDIHEGDVVVTSGLDGIFPHGLLVGTIKAVHREGPGMFINVAIAPAVDFRALEQVMVVRQTPPQVAGQPRS